MTTALFSIVTLCKGDAAALRLTGKSLSRQLDAPLVEWLVLGRGCDDKTVQDALSGHNAQIQARVIVCAAAGDEVALNDGLQQAKGRYVWFLPAGDCLADGFVLRDLQRELRNNPLADLVYGDVRYHGVIHKARDFSAMSRRPVTAPQAVLYRRETIGDLRFNAAHGLACDYDFMLRFTGRAERIHAAARLLCDLDDALHDARTGRQMLRDYHHVRIKTLGMAPWRSRLVYMAQYVRDLMRRWTGGRTGR